MSFSQAVGMSFSQVDENRMIVQFMDKPKQKWLPKVFTLIS